MLKQKLAQAALFVASHRMLVGVAVVALLALASLALPHVHAVRQLAEGVLLPGGQPA